MIFLARQVLDKEILDCDGLKGGKVDDLVLELRDGERPVVGAIRTQHGALACDMGGVIAGLAAWLRRTLLGLDPQVTPLEIGWEHVTRLDVTVHLDVSRGEANLLASERAIWERWISHLPYARR